MIMIVTMVMIMIVVFCLKLGEFVYQYISMDIQFSSGALLTDRFVCK